MLKTLGFTTQIIKINQEYLVNEIILARVVTVHKDRYIVRNESRVYWAEIMGNLRYTAESPSDFPVVGDWVEVIPMDKDSVIIKSVLNRYSTLERKIIGKQTESQLLASNIDIAFIVMSMNQDFNLNRLDRYISMCHGGGIQPIVVLTKMDLVDLNQAKVYRYQITERYPSVEVEMLSMYMEEPLKVFKQSLQAYRTYCFIGSSGVGKSTLVNQLLDVNVLKTKAISSNHNKGKHTTTHRELFVLPNGSIVIDTPGMREVGMSNHAKGIEQAFKIITELSEKCLFSNCIHTREDNCGVLEALDSGELSEDVYNNYMKLKREEEHYAQSSQKRKQSGKNLSKIIRHAQNQKRKNKY